jgi:hypothetical protein
MNEYMKTRLQDATAANSERQTVAHQEEWKSGIE